MYGGMSLLAGNDVSKATLLNPVTNANMGSGALAWANNPPYNNIAHTGWDHANPVPAAAGLWAEWSYRADAVGEVALDLRTWGPGYGSCFPTAADIDQNCVVNLADLERLIDCWLDPALCDPDADLFASSTIDLGDFSVLASQWQMTGVPSPIIWDTLTITNAPAGPSIQDNLVLYLPYDEGAGVITNDLSGNGFHGKLYCQNAYGGLYDTIKWAQPVLNDNHWTNGRFGKAIKFYSGTFPNSAWVGTKQTEIVDTHILGKGVYTENSAGGPSSAQDWSYSFWVKRPTDRSVNGMSSWINAFTVQPGKALTGDEAGVDYWTWDDLQYDQLHTRFSETGSGSGRYLKSGINGGTLWEEDNIGWALGSGNGNGTWQNIIMLFNGDPAGADKSVLSVYVNGSLVQKISGNTNGWGYLPAEVVTIGMTTMKGIAINDEVDDVGVWNRLLTPSEIAYLQSNPVKPAQLSPVNQTAPANLAVLTANGSMTWDAGPSGPFDSYNVYLGTSMDEVNSGAAGTLKGNQTGTSYAYSNLQGTYYWRVDGVKNGVGIAKGNVRQFWAGKWIQTEFVNMMGWTDIEQFQQSWRGTYADALYTMGIRHAMDPDTGMQHFYGKGIGVFIYKNPTTGSFAEQYKNTPTNKGYFQYDEPSVGSFGTVASYHNACRAADPSRPSYTNLLSSQGMGFGMSYNDYLEAFLTSVNPEVLSYDCYPYRYGIGNHWKSLEIARGKALNRGIPLWNWQETNQGGGTGGYVGSDLNKRRLRFVTYSSLAYGVKGFSWWGISKVFNVLPNTNESSFTQRTFTLGDAYNDVTAVNAEINRLGTAMVLLTSTAVYHTNSTSDTTLLPGNHWVQVPNSDPGGLVLGMFKDAQNKDYAMIANKSDTATINNKQVTFQNTAISTVSVFNEQTGNWDGLTVQGSYPSQYIVLPSMGPGYGKLLKIN